jgi:hypothetical protein
MYKELEKYKTGKLLPGKIEINGQIVDISLEEYKAGVGDLVNELIKLNNIPFYKKWFSYSNFETEYIKKIFTKMLNKIEVSNGL